MQIYRTLALTTVLFPLAAMAQDRPSGIDTSGFDHHVRVQDDLYMFVNGTWLSATEIPPDKTNYGSFTILGDLSQERIKEMIEKLAAEPHPQGSDAQKIGDLYKSFMNEDRVEQLGLSPAEPYLTEIRNIQDKSNLIAMMGKLRIVGTRRRWHSPSNRMTKTRRSIFPT